MNATETKYLLGLSQTIGMNQKYIRELISYFGDAETAWKKKQDWISALAIPEQKVNALISESKAVDVEAVFQYSKSLGVKVITCEDEKYPDPLRNIYEPPYFLYCLGELPSSDLLAIAVVGARKCSDYGRFATRKIVTDLVERANTVIISGMAEGIDAAAHWSALQAGGKTVAFLGCGIDVIYPSFHRKLYDSIIENGCVLSEYPFGYESLRQNFPYRNRLISGMSQGVVVAEGRMRSGSLHTVEHGLEQGKNIYAIPGSILDRGSELPHYLIEAGEAKFCASADDILEDFLDIGVVEQMHRAEEQDILRFAGNDKERKVLSELESGRRTADELAKISEMSISDLNIFLTELEIEGVVYRAPGNTIALLNQ